MNGKKSLLRIEFTAEVERYVRTAWLSLVGLTKIADGKTYSGEAIVTMSKDPPEFHTHDAMVPPHETSPHAIPARNIAVGGRGEIDLRNPAVTMTFTLKGKGKPLVYDIPPKPSAKSEKEQLGEYKIIAKQQSS